VAGGKNLTRGTKRFKRFRLWAKSWTAGSFLRDDAFSCRPAIVLKKFGGRSTWLLQVVAIIYLIHRFGRSGSRGKVWQKEEFF